MQYKKTHSSSIMAFPKSADYACSVNRYEEPVSHKAARVVFAAILVSGLVVGLLEYFGVLTQ